MDAFFPSFIWITSTDGNPITDGLIGDPQSFAAFFCRYVLIGVSLWIQRVNLTVGITAVPHGTKDVLDSFQLKRNILQAFSKSVFHNSKRFG